MVELGEKVADFELPASGGKTLRLSSFLGKKVVLYFYPKDNTPGCTTEGQNFRDLYAEFQAADTVILGVSKDSVKAHDSFVCKQSFPFDLLSDEDGKLCAQFDVYHQKNMYGRMVMGIERSTFVIDRDGTLRREWRKVKVPGHVDTVLAYVKSLP